MQMKDWTPNSTYGSQAFGVLDDGQGNAFELFLNRRDELMPWIKEYPPYYLATTDDHLFI